MAVLPVYDNRAGLADGGSVRMLGDSASQIGAAVSRFGESLQGAYLQGEKTDLTIAKIQDEEAKRAAGIDDTITRNDFVNTWQKKKAKLLEDMPPSGEGHVAAVEQAYDDHMAEYSGRFSPLREKENTSLLMQYRTQEVGSAITTEARVRKETTKALAESDFKTFADIGTEAGPEARDRFLTEATLKAKAYNFGPNMARAYMQDAVKSFETGVLQHTIKNKPYEVIKAADGVFAGMPAAGANDEVKSIVNTANAVGARSDLLLAIAHIETGGKFDPKLTPIGKDGKPMSSAGGVFQTLDGAYNLGTEKGTAAQARALGLYLNDAKDKVEGKGLQFTPGVAMMFHNVGDGLAMNILRAQPGEKMADIVARTYPSRPELAAQVLRNNPSLYNGNMTADQVRASYEAKMTAALSATQNYVTGDVGTTDDAANARLSGAMGIPVSHMGVKGLKTALDLARQDLATQNKAQHSLLVGAAIHSGQVRIDPYDPESAKHLNKYAETTGIGEAIRQGNPAAFAAASAVVQKTNVIPQPYENAYREVIMAGGLSEQKSAAYASLAGIMRDNPVAWSASKLPHDVKERVEKYATRTSGMGSIWSPADAIKHIDAEYTVEGDAAKKAARELWKNDKEAEIKALKFADVESAVSKGLWRNAAMFDKNSPTADVKKQVLMDQYESAYKSFREQGRAPDDAKVDALNQIKKAYGTSSVFRGVTERAELTAYPIEARYPEIDAKNPYKWIEEQGWNIVKLALIKQGYTDYANNGEIGTGNSLASRPEIRLVPTRRTMDEWNSDKPPSYDLMYRNPKTGKIELAMEAWYPNYADAQAAYDEKFLGPANRKAEERAQYEAPLQRQFAGNQAKKK